MGLGILEKSIIGHFVNDEHNDEFQICIVACLASIAEDTENMKCILADKLDDLAFDLGRN